MKLRRNMGVGIHRVRVPGHGWNSIRPGDEVPGDHDNIDFLGSQRVNYFSISGEMPQDKGPEPEPTKDYAMYSLKVTGGYNVINSSTGKPVNSKPLSAKDARKLLDLAGNDCPLKEGEFGKTFDEFEQCVDCVNSDGCKKGK